jgi:hypothetical protein
MSLSTQSRPVRYVRDERWLWRAVRLSLAALYGAGTLIHVWLGTFRPETYRHFADGAPDWVRNAWRDVFMAEPRSWALALATGELLIAVLLLAWPRLGYLAVLGFTAALVLFGWGFLIWSGPVFALVLTAMVRERRAGR